MSSNEEQARRCAETARALGCDEDEAAFRDKLGVIARHKPKDEPAHPASPQKVAPRKTK